MAFRTIPEESVLHEFIIGRKDICSFFDVQTWGTIRRWKRKHGLPVRYLPNNKPVLIKSEAIDFLKAVSK